MGHPNFASLLMEGYIQWQDRKCNNVFLFRDFLQYLGYWRASEAKRNLPSKYNFVLSRYVLGSAIVVTFFVLPYNLAMLHGTDIFAVCETVVTLFVAGMVLVHCGSFVLQPRRFDQVMAAYEELEELSRLHLSQPELVVVQGRRRANFILYYYAFFTVGIYPGIALGLPVYCEFTRDFFFQVWYPWDFKASPQFELTVLAWIVPFVVGCHLVVLVYVFLMSLFVEVVRHFQLLRHNLRHVIRLVREAADLVTVTDEQSHLALPEKAKTASTVDEHGNDSEAVPREYNANVKVIVVQEFLKGAELSDTSKMSIVKEMVRRKAIRKRKFEKKLQTAVENCVQHQVAINNLVVQISRAFYSILIHQFNSSVCPMIAAIVLITNTKGYDLRAALLIMTILGCLCPTAIFCWLADKVAEESELVRDALFGCDWLRASDSFKRSMRVIMSRSNQLVEIKVAEFIPLSLETFSKLIRLTFNNYLSLRTALQRSHYEK